MVGKYGSEKIMLPLLGSGFPKGGRHEVTHGEGDACLVVI